MSHKNKDFHVIGSTIRICSQVSVTVGSVVTVKSIVDPDNNEILSNQPMSFDDDENVNIATYLFDTDPDVHTTGKYKVITKVVNGSKKSLAKGYFYLEEE